MPSLALLAIVLCSGVAAATTVNLNPAKDNTILGDLTLNSNGAGNGVYAGRTTTGGARRGLLAFDLSSIPAGATINSVSLTLNMSQTVALAQTVALHRLNASWGESTSLGSGSGAPAAVGDATWLRRFYNTTSWTTSGGDFAGAPSATLSVGNVGSYTWTSAGLQSDVQFWMANPSSNFGWILVGNESTNQTTKKFDSREGAIPPVLTVNYTPAVPGVSGWGLALLVLVMAGSAAGFPRRRSEA
jgi:hypothetical protein